MFLRSIFVATLMLLLATWTSAAVAAESLRPQTTPLPLTVTPTTVRPGQMIRVVASGLAGLPIAGTNACLGILGPGQNVQLNVAPSFRPQIGMIAISANGTGQADAQVPANLVAGSYQVILGGCSPHGNIAPLATIAQGTITVIGPASVPVPRLPASGGIPLSFAVGLVGLVGLGSLLTGIRLRSTMGR